MCHLNRFAPDDLCFLAKVRELGLTGSVRFFYMTWLGRWSALTLIELLLSSYRYGVTVLMLQGVFTVIILNAALHLALKQICALLDMQLNFSQQVSLTLLATGCIFYGTASIPDTWFSLSSSIMYLWSPIALIAAWTLLYRRSWLSRFLICILGLYIGAANEVLPLCLLAFMLVHFINHSSARDLRFNNILLFLSVLFSFLLLVKAPGNYIRKEQLPEAHLIPASIIFIKSILKFSVRTFYCLLRSTPFLLLFYGFGAAFSEQLKAKDALLRKAAKQILIGLGIAIPITYLFLAIIMSEMGPGRAWTHLSFLALFYCMLQLARLGARYPLKNGIYIGYFSLITMILYSVYEIPISMRYTEKVDERLKMIAEHKQKGSLETLTVPPLPWAGYLFSAEISEKPGHYLNRNLKVGLDLSFDVKRSPFP